MFILYSSSRSRETANSYQHLEASLKSTRCDQGAHDSHAIYLLNLGYSSPQLSKRLNQLIRPRNANDWIKKIIKSLATLHSVSDYFGLLQQNQEPRETR